MDKLKYKEHASCRICGNSNLVKYLDFGHLPMANNYQSTKEESLEQERFPVQVLFCNVCSLSQLSVVVDADNMYSYYTYRSGISHGYMMHCIQMAVDLAYRFQLHKYSYHIDIAGNDGTLLKEFKELIGHRVLNVDPAQNLCDIARRDGIASMPSLWNKHAVQFITGTMKEKADLITATNVLAHVDDVNEFMKNIKLALKDTGHFILEVPYIVDFIENCEFDTIYLEHLSYFGITSLSLLCQKNGLKIVNIERYAIHGGTIRLTIVHSNSNESLPDDEYHIIENETQTGYNSIDKYYGFASRVILSIQQFKSGIHKLISEGHRIAAFAASAKGNTLLNVSGIDSDSIQYLIDETPEKIGKFYPGLGMQVWPIDILRNTKIDYLVILSWNFAKDIIDKCKSKGYTGKFIIPIPEFTIIE